MFDEIKHVAGEDHQLIAADFSQEFVMRALVADSQVEKYAALRLIGCDQVSSFLAAFGGTLYGHPDAIQKAAEAFERTGQFESAVEDMRAVLGDETINAELRKRCDEVSGFTRDIAMELSRVLHKRAASQHLSIVDGSVKRYVNQYRDFMEERRKDRETVARRAASFNADRGVI